MNKRKLQIDNLNILEINTYDRFKKYKCINGETFIPINNTNKIYNLYDFKDFVQINKGSFGTVYTAIEIVSNLKICLKKIEFSSHLKDFIYNEISVHQQINSEYVAKLYGWFKTDHNLYLMLEYVDIDMFDFITNMPELNESKILKYLKNIAKCIQHIHNHNIIHRDIKLENLLLCKQTDIIKICDFGLATYMNNMICTDVGTHNYTAPELKYQGYYDHKYDIYAFGIVAYLLMYKSFPKFTNNQIEFPYAYYASSTYKELVLSLTKYNVYERMTLEEFFEHKLIKNI